MSFDAGEIKAYLVLDRSKFNEGLDQALADAKAKTEKGVDVKVKPELDETAMDEVLAEEEPLRKDIEPQVKPSYAKGEAESVGKTIGADILNGLDQGGGNGVGADTGILAGYFDQMFKAGASKSQITQWARDMGKTEQEIADALAMSMSGGGGGGNGAGTMTAERLIKRMLPSREQLGAALQSVISSPEYQKSIAPDFASVLLEDIMGRSIGSGAVGGGASGGGDIRTAAMLEDLIRNALGKGASQSVISSALRDAGFGKSEISTAIVGALRGGINDIESNGGAVAVRRDFGAMLSSISGPGNILAQGFDSLSANGPMGAIMNPLGMSAGVAFLGAFGAAIAGGLSATIIGAAGTMTALVPGFLDLMHGYAAYQAISTGASTKGMSSGSIGLGKSIQGLLGAGSKGLGAAENQIMPQITKFINALDKAMPLMNEFAKPAIAAMSGFFNAIDKGLGSGGFKSFIGDMSKLVGPIMTEFGKVIRNLGGALGGFLKLFGGVGAKQIGPWFVKITGELDHFLNHVKLGHGFVKGMTTVFSDLGKEIPAVVTGIAKLGVALAPVGMQVFRVLGWLGSWATRIVKLVPPWLITSIVGLVVAFKGLSIALDILDTVMGVMDGIIAVTDVLVDAGPLVIIVAVGAAILALVAIVYELKKHWKAVWGFIKLVVVDTWHFIDNEVFHPIAHFFTVIFDGALKAIKRTWDTVWNGIKDTIKTVWDFIKPIFDAIKTAIGDVMGAVGKVTGALGKIGGGALGAIIHAGSDVLNFVSHPFGLAAGGTTQANKLQLVGEQGPELFVPSTAGTVIPNGQFGGGQQIVFQIDARGHSNPSQVVQAVRNGIGATLPTLQAALARGAA